MYLCSASDMSAPTQRRRRHPRFGIQCRARIQIGQRHYAGYIQDISEGGAKLRTVSSIRRLGVVILRLPDLPPLKCRLRWTDTYHAGVIFELPLTKDELRRWVTNRVTHIALNTGPEPDCELVEPIEEAAAA